jgi:hypothetical protein
MSNWIPKLSQSPTTNYKTMARLWNFEPIIDQKLNYKTILQYLFLTNLEDEISVKGVGFVKPKNLYQIKIMI